MIDRIISQIYNIINKKRLYRTLFEKKQEIHERVAGTWFHAQYIYFLQFL